MDEKYRSLLIWSLKKRFLVIGVVAAVTFTSIILMPLVGTEFMPSQDSGQFNVDVQMPIGTVLSDTGEVMNRICEMVRQVPEVETVLTTVGGRGFMGGSQTEAGSINARLKPKADRKRTTDQVVQELQMKTRGMPGATIRVSSSASGMGMLSRAFSGRPIEMRLKAMT